MALLTPSQEGGAILAHAATVTAIGASFTSNKAAVRSCSTARASFSHASSLQTGGAVFAESSGSLDIVDAHFKSNSATRVRRRASFAVALPDMGPYTGCRRTC